MASVEIICPACGADTLLRRESVYEGLRVVGVRRLCASCGHVFEREEDVPFKQTRTTSIFSEADRGVKVEIFRDDEKGHTCRYCEHYVVNPFTQWCGLHHKDVEATDTCGRFSARPQKPAQE